MKLLLVLIAFIALPAVAQSGRSAFATVRFGEVVQVDLPRNWTYMDKSVADHLNTSSEAVASLAGVTIAQGDNTILVAANAYDGQGKSKATLRISVRAAPGLTQAQMRELSVQPLGTIDSQLRPSAEATVTAMLKVPGVKSYSVREVKIDRNGSLVCMLSSFEGDFGRGPVISATWVCPLGDSTLKLSTSYEKSSQAIYGATLARVWRNLQAPAPK
ncbi:MAG: hypothetical protein ACYCZA_12565 [Thiobacillus sp.]